MRFRQGRRALPCPGSDECLECGTWNDWSAKTWHSACSNAARGKRTMPPASRTAALCARRPPSAISSLPTAAPARPATAAFRPKRGRYHLYVSLACPWAHRTLIFRKLKKLDEVISVSVVEPLFGKRGWEFGTGPGVTLDTVNGKSTLADIYLLTDPNYTGRVTVPVLWDKKRHTIVNNEFLRNHPHAQFGVRCVHRRAHRLLSGRAARRDRPDE